MSGSQNYGVPNLALPYIMPSNIPDAFKPLFKPIYTALQNIIQTLITYAGISPRPPAALLSSNNDPTACLAGNVHRFYTIATEPIAQGAAINLYASAGTLFVRNANATDGTKPADGFCSSVGGITSGGIGEVILSNGMCTTVASSFVVGTRYYLGTTSGSYTSTAPVAAGNLQQSVGIAINATTLYFLAGNQTQH